MKKIPNLEFMPWNSISLVIQLLRQELFHRLVAVNTWVRSVIMYKSGRANTLTLSRSLSQLYMKPASFSPLHCPPPRQAYYVLMGWLGRQTLLPPQQKFLFILHYKREMRSFVFKCLLFKRLTVWGTVKLSSLLNV